jgi:3-deoxy-7-phosphoheptulonate synthase
MVSGTPLALAAIAAGADGLLIEVHPNPDLALADGPQSLNFDSFRLLMSQLAPVAEARNRKLDTPSAKSKP